MRITSPPRWAARRAVPAAAATFLVAAGLFGSVAFSGAAGARRVEHAAPVATTAGAQFSETPVPTTAPATASVAPAEPVGSAGAGQAMFCGADAPSIVEGGGNEPVRVIFDTDFGPDVDDAGALAVLHALADAGEADILAVMLSNAGDDDAAGAIDVVNTFYGRPDIPIGLPAATTPAHESRYTAALAAEFDHQLDAVVDATSLYRRILAAEPDGSVTIVSVGFLGNLADLITSEPDVHSDMSGAELVAAKVKAWVVMGGHYPDSVDHPRGREFNLAQDKQAAIVAVATWPTPVVFSGWEIGAGIETGAVLATGAPPGNPVREAYRLYTGGEDRASFDLTAVLYAVRGTAGVFDVCRGENRINPDGSNVWQHSAEGDHGYLRMVSGPEEVATLLDELLLMPPRSSAVG